MGKRLLRITLLLLASAAGAASAHASAPEPRESYYLFLFAYQTPVLNRPKDSHTFATLVRTTEAGTFLDAFTISWLPERLKDPEADIKPLGPAEAGANLGLAETLTMGRKGLRRPTRWGPFQVTPAFYAKARSQYEFLNSRQAGYIVLDGGTRAPALRREPGGAVNCIHAVSDTTGLRLDTGWERGASATDDVLLHFLEGDRDRNFIGYPRIHEWLAVHTNLDWIPLAQSLPWRDSGDGTVRRIPVADLVRDGLVH